uniref:Uncharacterized protein n=1 Tax=Arundo donax TaxID=35708 RepID=A0A0A9GKE4_ARUDO
MGFRKMLYRIDNTSEDTAGMFSIIYKDIVVVVLRNKKKTGPT